jgi:pyruvate,water dikinase
VARALAAEVLEVDAALEDVEAGGKALGLAAILRAGCKVPEAFVISANAFARHSESLPVSASTLADADPGLAEAIAAGWESLGCRPVAVRSSGLREDSAGGSQAGRHLTLLNVATFGGLLEAVVEVWRHAGGLGTGEAVAVVVQRQLRPVSAGVMFTSSPEAPDQVLIESRWGLGTGVVGGRDSDRVVVDGTDGVKARVATKVDLVVPDGGGGTIHSPTPSELVEACSLSEKDARRLARLGRRLEKALGAPQDVEWALVEGGEIYLVQSRPVAVPDSWDAGPPAQPFDLWSRVNVIDLLPDLVSPFTWSLARPHWYQLRRRYYRPFRLHGLDQVGFFRLWNQRLYFNVGASYHLRARLGRGHEVLAPRLSGTEAPARHGARPRGVRLWRLAFHLPGVLAASAWSVWQRRGTRTRFEAAASSVAELRAQTLDDQPLDGLWARFQSIWAEIERLEMLESAVDDAVFAAGRHLEILCHRWLGGPELFVELVAGDAAGGATAIAEEIAALAATAPPAVRERLRGGGALDLGEIRQLAPEWSLSMDAFLDRHGHRTRSELDLAQPRWAEDPAPVLDAIRPMLDVAGSRRKSSTASPDAAAGRALAILRELPGERLFPWRRLLFLAVLGRARRLMPFRSIPRDRVMHMYLGARRVLLEISRRLVEGGQLKRREDLFLLTVSDVEALTGGQPGLEVLDLIERRRLRQLAAAAQPAPDVLSADGRPLIERGPSWDPTAGLTMAGLGAVPGIARGPVRMLARVDDVARIRPGDVLLLASTDVGSTLLFPLAAAMIVEEGGLLSHASVLAREYGLPTVIQVAGASERLQDGVMVEVDGGRGLVTLLSDA